MTINKIWLAAIAIALASSTQVQAQEPRPNGPLPPDDPWPWETGGGPESGFYRDLSEQVFEWTIDEARWLLEHIESGNLANDANACILITSTIGVVMVCPPRPRLYDCPIEPYCMKIWEWRR